MRNTRDEQTFITVIKMDILKLEEFAKGTEYLLKYFIMKGEYIEGENKLMIYFDLSFKINGKCFKRYYYTYGESFEICISVDNSIIVMEDMVRLGALFDWEAKKDSVQHLHPFDNFSSVFTYMMGLKNSLADSAVEAKRVVQKILEDMQIRNTICKNNATLL